MIPQLPNEVRAAFERLQRAQPLIQRFHSPEVQEALRQLSRSPAPGATALLRDWERRSAEVQSLLGSLPRVDAAHLEALAAPLAAFRVHLDRILPQLPTVPVRPTGSTAYLFSRASPPALTIVINLLPGAPGETTPEETAPDE
jgi:hypothetical protein